MTIAEQLRQEARYEGMQQGMHKGEHEAKLEVAKNLFTQGISLEIIKKSTASSDHDLAPLVKGH